MKEKKAKPVSANHSPRGANLRLPLLAFYLNIKGEVDPQRHIVKPVTPITKAVKWAENGRGRARGSGRSGEGGEGPGGERPGDANISRARAGDCTAVAGKKSKYDEQSAFGSCEPGLTRAGEPDGWKGIVLTRRRAGGCRGAARRERLASHEGTLKHWQDLLRSCHWLWHLFIYLFVCFSICGVHSAIRHARYGKCDWRQSCYKARIVISCVSVTFFSQNKSDIF